VINTIMMVTVKRRGESLQSNCHELSNGSYLKRDTKT